MTSAGFGFAGFRLAVRTGPPHGPRPCSPCCPSPPSASPPCPSILFLSLSLSSSLTASEYANSTAPRPMQWSACLCDTHTSCSDRSTASLPRLPNRRLSCPIVPEPTSRRTEEREEEEEIGGGHFCCSGCWCCWCRWRFKCCSWLSNGFIPDAPPLCNFALCAAARAPSPASARSPPPDRSCGCANRRRMPLAPRYF